MSSSSCLLFISTMHTIQVYCSYCSWVGQLIRVKKTRGARGQTPCRRVMERAAMSDVRFWRRFHQWLCLFLLYTVVWSKHNFDNFHFLAKIKHHFKPSALIPIVGEIRPVMYWSLLKGGEAQWHNILRGSAKPPTSTGESHFIIGRERIKINTWRRITSTQLTAHTLYCIWQ